MSETNWIEKARKHLRDLDTHKGKREAAVIMAGLVEQVGLMQGTQQTASEDYNHARMLYKRAIDVAPNATRDAISLAVYALSQTTDDFVTELDLTAQQLTEACCAVLEAHDDPNRPT